MSAPWNLSLKPAQEAVSVRVLQAHQSWVGPNLVPGLIQAPCPHLGSRQCLLGLRCVTSEICFDLGVSTDLDGREVIASPTP